MFSLNCKHFVNPEMSKYIKEQYNRSLIKYLNNSVVEKPIGLKVSDLVKEKYKKPICLNSQFFFISLISFLAGYNFRYLIKRH